MHRRAPKQTIESCIREVVSRNTDWVATYGPDAEAWHDRVDQAGVEAGRQKSVGDGSPMTAWFHGIRSFEQFDVSTCYGVGPVLLILIGFPGAAGVWLRLSRSISELTTAFSGPEPAVQVSRNFGISGGWLRPLMLAVNNKMPSQSKCPAIW